MNYLVTGGAGFIGSHLVDLLLANGHRVTVLDDLSTGSRHNLSSHPGSTGLNFIRGSILDRDAVNSAVQGMDFVFHLAAAVGVNQIVGSPVRSLVTNTTGTHNVLDACSLCEVPMLLTSTSEIYGKSLKEKFSEDDDIVLGPTTKSRWSYATSKALDEFLALAYQHERGLQVFIARLFNTVGPRQTGRYGMVLPRFVGQAITGEPITVYGDGEQSRVFVHVQDIVPALVGMSERPALAGEVINLGGYEELSMNDLARRVLKVTNSSSSIAHIPYDDAYDVGFEDMRRRKPDISKAARLLEFNPMIDLDMIIADVAEHLKVTVG